MKKIVVIMVVVVKLLGDPYKETMFDIKKITEIGIRNNIDFDSKSNKGWLRVLNSKEKLEYYGYSISNNEINILVLYFKYKIKNNKERIIR